MSEGLQAPHEREGMTPRQAIELLAQIRPKLQDANLDAAVLRLRAFIEQTWHEIGRANKLTQDESRAIADLLLDGEWHRHDGQAYLSVRVPDGSDLSCRATREDAVRAVLAGKPLESNPGLVPADESDSEEVVRRARLNGYWQRRA